MTTDRSTKGRIFDIQRFCIHDGPGIRTTVFMKGCVLRCLWCHNPEGIRAGRELSFAPDRCIGCGYCFRVCPREAHQMEDGRHVLRRDRCVVCGDCTRECYAKAAELVGRDVSVQEALDEVLRDKPFYETSGGGLTLSGGEPTLQIDFAGALLRAAKEEGVHTAVETCGCCEWARIEQVLPFTDLFLYDYKETDPARHREFTGADNAPILDNLRRIDAQGKPVILRCPIVPGLNDREDHLAGIVQVAESLKHLVGVEVMPYHRLGEGKLDRFGLGHMKRAQAEPPSADQAAAWRRRIGKYLLPG